MIAAITTSEIQAGIAEQYRCYFLVSAAELPRDCLSVIESFWEAVRVFAPAARLSAPVHVIIATRPFRIKLSSGVLQYEPCDETINAAIEHFVFLDVAKLAALAKPLQVACILEELVHAAMHVSDENLVSLIVTHLYRGVVLVDGRYSAATTPTS